MRNGSIQLGTWLIAGAVLLSPAACSGVFHESSSQTSRDLDTWNSYARGFFADYCTRCHDADHPGGDYRRYEEVARDARRIRCGLPSERQEGCGSSMPPPGSFPTGPRPPESEIDRIVNWIEQGVPRR